MGKMKTRRERKDIKVLDKPMTVAERIKKSHVRTKEDMAQTQEHAVPVEYAENKVVGGMDIFIHKGVHHASLQGGRLVQAARERSRYSKEFKNRREELQRERTGKSLQERQSVSTSSGETDSQPGEQRKGKKLGQTADQRRNNIKTTQPKEQKSIKNARKSVRTRQRTTIKSTEKAVKQTQQTAKAAKQTARKTAQVAKQSMKAAIKTGKATTKAAKAIIEATKALITALISFGWIAVLSLIIVLLFGGFLCMTGGDNSSTVTPVSAEVQAYEPVIRKYAKQYKIGEYVELIKAVMMQESGGQGNDPMQSSEGIFNTRYPRKPNGITEFE